MAQGISKIMVKGFKSLYDETSVDIRPLTILAGANSSGKSSIMQPLLLMKQTLESTYTPKVFKLDGPNVRYTDPRQFFHIDLPNSEFKVELEVSELGTLTTVYSLINRDEILINETVFISDSERKLKSKSGELISSMKLWHDMSHEDLAQQVPQELDDIKNAIQNITTLGDLFYGVGEYRSFLDINIVNVDGILGMEGPPMFYFFPLQRFIYSIQDIIHVPGLRDNPRRNYPLADIDGHFEGTFDKYFASVIADWGEDEQAHKQFSLSLLDSLMDIELADGLHTSTHSNEVVIEVSHAFSGYYVNIADVGLGVSQVLPVLVALLVAKEGQLVYLEQPELHLHPRAQVKLAQIIADASNRGVRVVVETHSSLLLIGIQTLIAEGKLNPEDTILHWFTRGEDGKTTVDSRIPNETGAYGDWPEDFADVELQAQTRYLNAVDERLFGQPE